METDSGENNEEPVLVNVEQLDFEPIQIETDGVAFDKGNSTFLSIFPFMFTSTEFNFVRITSNFAAIFMKSTGFFGKSLRSRFSGKLVENFTETDKLVQ